MKKSLLILCAAVLALVSCNKDLTPNEAKQGEPIDVVFNLSATHPDGTDTKAVKTAWETGDVVFVFFSGQTAPAYLELKFDGTKWVNTPKGLSFSEGDTGTMTAVYLPFGSGATVVDDGSGGYKFDKTYYSYFLTSSMSYTVSGGEVSGTFAMQIPDGYVQFFFNLETSIDLIEIREPHLTPQGIASITKDGDVALTNVAHGAPLPGYRYKDGSGYVFSGILSDDARNDKGEEHIIDYHFTMVVNGWNGSYFSKVCEGKQLYRGEKEGRALRFEGNWGGSDYKPIDLGCDVTVDGVTKRIYWSSRNIGATADTGEASYGDYYAWGETATKESYAWTNYIFAKDPSDYSSGVKKYSEEDSYKTLFPEDDAATSLWKDPWRMPTVEEWAVLRDATLYTWKWETNYNGSGKNGMLVTRKEGTGPCAGNSIFLPAAGRWFESQWLYGGSRGFYWSSSLDVTALFAMGVEVLDSGFRSLTADRYAGLNVRPVTD